MAIAIEEEISAEQRAKYLEAIQKFRLMDDTFMSKVFEDKECTELLLRIILQKELTVKSVSTQYSIKNLQGHSSKLDVYAVDANGEYYNIEIQQASDGASPKRARYYSSLLDGNILAAGDDYDNLAATYVIFITEKDVLHGGKPYYTIDRTIAELDNVSFEDKSHIVYVNGEYRDSSELGRLMQDFTATNPDDMYYKTLADRVRNFKVYKEGQSTMCKIMEELSAERVAKAEARAKTEAEVRTKIQTALRMLAQGKFSFEDIANIADLPLEEVKKLAEQHSA